MYTELLITFIIAIGINIVMFIPAFIWKTDKLTDISYAVTFIVLALYGLFFGDMNTQKIVLTAMIGLWGVRLGTYLLIRIWKTGRDKRFDDKRDHFWKFLGFWLLQGLTVWVVMIPATLMLYAETTTVSALTIIGGVIWITGLLLETIADYQKYTFINNPKNTGKWIQSGVWSISRHPNYLGEIMVWVGLYLFSVCSLTVPEKLIALVGPLFIAGLIIFVSGIPLLEQYADKKWGDDPKYQAYKKRTGVLFPKIFHRS